MRKTGDKMQETGDRRQEKNKFFCFSNEKGIALVMVLVLAFMALAIVSSLLFMVTTGTRLSGGLRFFRTAEEASVGGSLISAEFVKDNATLPPGLSWSTVRSSGCLTQKLNTSGWGAGAGWTTCGANDTSLDSTVNSDTMFDMSNYRVYVKIVDTVEGNTSTSSLITAGGELGGAGVVASTTEQITPSPRPYIYRIEVQAQDNTNPRERSRMSVLYAK